MMNRCLFLCWFILPCAIIACGPTSNPTSNPADTDSGITADAGPALATCGALATCNGTCTDTANNPANCGGCGTSCGAGGICRAGVCSLHTPATVVCGIGTGNCDRNDTNGCEINLQSDRNNCGACGRACASSESCQVGTCVPTCGQTACNGVCVDTQIDPNNCGVCNNRCGANATCTAGSCRSTTVVCGAGTGNCDGNDSNRCETNTTNNPANCGGCGRACAAGQFCANSVCVNNAPVCNGQICGGQCVDTSSNRAHCGGCNNVCLTNQSCTNSQCITPAVVCPAPMMNCDGIAANGCESNTQFDANNCGACGFSCLSGHSCRAGRCIEPSSCSGSGQTYCSGICVNTQNDANNCGACNARCSSGQTCTGGTCTGGTSSDIMTFRAVYTNPAGTTSRSVNIYQFTDNSTDTGYLQSACSVAGGNAGAFTGHTCAIRARVPSRCIDMNTAVELSTAESTRLGRTSTWAVATYYVGGPITTYGSMGAELYDRSLAGTVVSNGRDGGNWRFCF